MTDTWILTHTGRYFDYVSPDVDQIDLVDIAVGLSRESRFNGQTQGFYSVAQHSVLASLMVEPPYAMEALLHDASEAYCKDLPRPVKALLPGYKQIERRVDAVIREKFSLPPAMSAQVKLVDRIMLATERRDLVGFAGKGARAWKALEGVRPFELLTIYPWSEDKAQQQFVSRFNQLSRRP